jgi:predicted pyridoxine 5'-phosphate oxidase superfamily flavin-nucleotide-binding protein
MRSLYGPQHRALQDQFDTRRIADKLAVIAHHTEITEQDRAFIESRDLFWLASVDHEGRPTVSYKGGDPGLVRVLDASTLAFPSYDGNGMFYSMGNIAGQGSVGLLFMDMEKPFRLRVQGTATVDANDPLLATWKEAQLVVRVAVTHLFPNCPRYVHRYERVASSRYVPRAGAETPFAGWKRIDLVQQDLPRADQGRATQCGGEMPIEEWFGKVACGDPDA